MSALTSLRAILKSAAKALGVERAARAALIEEMWPEIVGTEAAAHSRPGALRGETLLAEVESGLWAQELSAQRGRFAGEINRRLGERVVTDIRFAQVAGWVERREAKSMDRAPDAEPDLTAEEQAAIEQAAAEIADPEVREAARRAMVSQVRWRRLHVRPPGR